MVGATIFTRAALNRRVVIRTVFGDLSRNSENAVVKILGSYCGNAVRAHQTKTVRHGIADLRERRPAG